MNWKPAILLFWKRREVKLAFLGLLLVAIMQWSFLRMNLEGTVTLEFVEMVTRGRGTEEGTLAKFRLRNESGGEIRYYGEKPQEPYCRIQPLAEGTYAEGGEVFRPDPSEMYYHGVWPTFAVPAGEEATVYALVWRANGPWRMEMKYNVDRRGWMKYIPPRFQNWFMPQSASGSTMVVVASEAVDIKMSGLDINQRSVLAQYRKFSKIPPLGTLTVVTNADGSFELKQVRITRNTTEP